MKGWIAGLGACRVLVALRCCKAAVSLSGNGAAPPLMSRRLAVGLLGRSHPFPCLTIFSCLRVRVPTEVSVRSPLMYFLRRLPAGLLGCARRRGVLPRPGPSRRLHHSHRRWALGLWQHLGVGGCRRAALPGAHCLLGLLRQGGGLQGFAALPMPWISGLNHAAWLVALFFDFPSSSAPGSQPGTLPCKDKCTRPHPHVLLPSHRLCLCDQVWSLAEGRHPWAWSSLPPSPEVTLSDFDAGVWALSAGPVSNEVRGLVCKLVPHAVSLLVTPLGRGSF